MLPRLRGFPFSRWLLLAWGMVAVIYVLTVAGQSSGGDDSVYQILAKSIASGHGFSRLDIAGEPPETQYPPGWPFLLAGIARLFPDVVAHLFAYQAWTALFTIVAFPVAVLVLRQGSDVSGSTLILLVALAFLNPYMLFVSCQQTLSEPSYIFLSYVSILLLETAFDRRRSRWLALLGLAAGVMCYYVRVVGLALLFSILVYLLHKRQWRTLVICAIGAVCLLLPWAVRNWTQGLSPLGGAYGDIFMWRNYNALDATRVGSLAEIFGRFLANLRGHIFASNPALLVPALRGPNIAGFLQGHGLGWLSSVFGATAAALMVTGYGRRLRRGPRLLEIYVPVYVGFILLPPWVESRNMLPILPVLLVYLYEGAHVLIRATAGPSVVLSRIFRSGAYALVAVMLVSVLASDRHMLRAASDFRSGHVTVLRPVDDGFLQVANWIKANTRIDDLVFYLSPEKVFLYTGRQTAYGLPAMPKPAFFFPEEEVLSDIYQEVDYLVTLPKGDPSSPASGWMQAVLDQHAVGNPERYRLVFRSSGDHVFNVYRILRSSSAGGVSGHE